MNKNIMYVTLSTIFMLLIGILYTYSVYRVEIEHLYDVTEIRSGLPYMVALMFFSIFVFIGGLLYNRYDTRYVGLLGVVLISLGFITTSLANSILFITLCYGVLIGSGVGILYGLPLRIVAQLKITRVGLATGVALFGFGMSSLIFAPLISFLMNKYSLSTTFFVIGIGYLFILSPFVLLLAKKDDLEKFRSKISFEVLKKSEFYFIYLLFFIGTFVGLTFIGLVGNIGEDLIGIEPVNIATFVGVFAIFNGIGRPLFGYLNDKIGFRKSALISYSTIVSVSILFIFFTSNIIVFVIAFIIYYINFGGWLSLAPAVTLKTFGKSGYSVNYGLMYTSYGFGAILGTLSSGYLIENFSYIALLVMMSIMALIGLFVTSTAIKKSI